MADTFELHRGLKNLFRKDSHPNRRLAFESALRRYRLTFAFQILEKSSHLFFLVSVLYGLKKCFFNLGENLVQVFYEHENEKVFLEKLFRAAPLSFSFKPASHFSLGELVRFIFRVERSRIKKVFHIFRLTERRFPAYMRLRAIEYFIYFAVIRSKTAGFSSRKKINLVIASDGSPFHLALLHALHDHPTMRVFLLKHAYRGNAEISIDCHFALLSSANERDRYLSRGSHFQKVALFEPTEPKKFHSFSDGVVCIGLSKAQNPTMLVGLCRALAKLNQVREIRVRPHPNFRVRLSELVGLQKVVVSRLVTAEEEVARCQILVAANSNLHLDFLLAGKPSLYFQNLEPVGAMSTDLLEECLLYNCDRVSEVAEAIQNSSRLVQFYNDNFEKSALRNYGLKTFSDEFKKMIYRELKNHEI